MASLPSGYTKLEYIESSGTQYIDTGVSSFPAQSTRVILDVDWLSGTGDYFGCAQSQRNWYVEAFQSTKIYSGYLDEGKSAGISTVIGRYIVDKNGVYTDVNGVKIQHASASTTISRSIYLWLLTEVRECPALLMLQGFIRARFIQDQDLSGNLCLAKIPPVKSAYTMK